MAAKPFYHDIDLVKVGQLLNARIHNITTADRGTLAGTLNAAHKGLMVYDTDLSKYFGWDGSSFSDLAPTISGALTYQGAVAYNATEPVAPGVGDYYIFTSAGSNTWEGTVDVQIGDSVVYDGTAWNFIQGNVVDGTESVKGVLQLASNAETITGSNTTKAATPSGVAAKLADYKAAKVYFVSSATLVANTPLTVAHNLSLQNRNAFTINCMDSAHSAISVDVDSVDQNNLTVTSSVALSGVGITVIGF